MDDFDRLMAPSSIPAAAPDDKGMALPSTDQPGAEFDVSALGRVEILTPEFAMGWASVAAGGRPALVYAVLGNEVLGMAEARLTREDLDEARSQGSLNAFAFCIVFGRSIPGAAVGEIQIRSPDVPRAFMRARTLVPEVGTPLRIFLMGSPRSGTSELGNTLAKALGSAWDGEGHAGPLFSSAAEALTGDVQSRNNLVRFMGRQSFRNVAINAAREAYFAVHSSASFLDKTPGAEMVRAALFLSECFDHAKFIFVRRHPVSNILSRLERFGGVFEEHCSDWAAVMNEWLAVRDALPDYLELQQEDMLIRPLDVASEIATYVGHATAVDTLGSLLSIGRLELTGAGLGKTRLAETDWTTDQRATFCRVVGPSTKAFGYALDD